MTVKLLGQQHPQRPKVHPSAVKRLGRPQRLHCVLISRPCGTGSQRAHCNSVLAMNISMGELL